jgi:hypothetical protein
MNDRSFFWFVERQGRMVGEVGEFFVLRRDGYLEKRGGALL